MNLWRGSLSCYSTCSDDQGNMYQVAHFLFHTRLWPVSCFGALAACWFHNQGYHDGRYLGKNGNGGRSAQVSTLARFFSFSFKYCPFNYLLSLTFNSLRNAWPKWFMLMTVHFKCSLTPTATGIIGDSRCHDIKWLLIKLLNTIMRWTFAKLLSSAFITFIIVDLASRFYHENWLYWYNIQFDRCCIDLFKKASSSPTIDFHLYSILIQTRLFLIHELSLWIEWRINHFHQIADCTLSHGILQQNIPSKIFANYWDSLILPRPSS